MLTTHHGDVTASSVQAEALITITALGQCVILSPDELRQIIAEHSPEGFYDD